jgi:hypothetical protein
LKTHYDEQPCRADCITWSLFSKNGKPRRNRASAIGIIATEAMLKAPPDRYTLPSTTTDMSWQTRVLYRKLSFDLSKGIGQTTVFPSGPLIDAVQENTGIRNLKELVLSKSAAHAYAASPIAHARPVSRPPNSQWCCCRSQTL